MGGKESPRIFSLISNAFGLSSTPMNRFYSSQESTLINYFKYSMVMKKIHQQNTLQIPENIVFVFTEHKFRHLCSLLYFERSNDALMPCYRPLGV